MTKAELHQYQKEIKKKLPFSYRKGRRLLKDLFLQMDDFIENTPDCTAEKVRANFGAPDIIAASILSPEEAIVYSKKAKRVKIWIGIAMLMAIALGFTVYCLYRINENNSNYYRFSSSESEPVYHNQGE